MKRANALLSYYRWHCVNVEGNCYPLREGQLWQYLTSMADDGPAATKAASMIQAVPFSWYILQVDGADTCISSRRILGQAEIQLAGKRATGQARPLTVQEVLTLHKTAADAEQPLSTRVMAVHLLLMLYTVGAGTLMYLMCNQSCMTLLEETSNQVVTVSFSCPLVIANLRYLLRANHCSCP